MTVSQKILNNIPKKLTQKVNLAMCQNTGSLEINTKALEYIQYSSKL